MWTIILSADKKPVYIAYKTPFQLRSAAMRVQAFFKVTELKNNKTQRPSIKNNIVPFKRGTRTNDICKQTVYSKTTSWRLHIFTCHFILDLFINAKIFLREKRDAEKDQWPLRLKIPIVIRNKLET